MANLQSVPADSFSPLPWSSNKYFDLLEALFRSDPEDWRPAVAALKHQGDRFSLVIIEQAQRRMNSVEKQEALDALYMTIQPKFKALRPEEVQALLERDAYADMMCPWVEYSLRDWTKDFLRSQLYRPEIREELERLQKSYVCDEKILELEKYYDSNPVIREMQVQQWKEKAQFHRMNEEVKERAVRLLHEPVPVPDL